MFTMSESMASGFVWSGRNDPHHNRKRNSYFSNKKADRKGAFDANYDTTNDNLRLRRVQEIGRRWKLNEVWIKDMMNDMQSWFIKT